MSNGVNKVILIGNLGKDPETKYMPNGGAVTNITIATSESWADKTSGQKQERTEWHRIKFFNKLAEIAGEFLRKGSKVYIEGALRTNKWQDQAGNDRYTTEIIASTMQMLGGKSGDAQQSQQAQPNQQPFQKLQNKPYAYQQPEQQQAPAQPAQGFDNFDDDICF